MHLSASLLNRSVGTFAGICLPFCQWTKSYQDTLGISGHKIRLLSKKLRFFFVKCHLLINFVFWSQNEIKKSRRLPTQGPCLFLSGRIFSVGLKRKKIKFSSYIKKNSVRAVAKSYMRKEFLYEAMRKYLTIYEEAFTHIWLCNCTILNFLMYEENFIYFFISVAG